MGERTGVPSLRVGDGKTLCPLLFELVASVQVIKSLE